MAESDFTFTNAPSFTESAFPPPPQRGAKDVDKYLKEIEQYLQVQLVGLTDMQASITEGWIVDVLRVNGLEANTILANSIITNDFFVGSDGSGSIEMSGTTTQIIIKDEAGVNRVIMGDFGASNSDWGIKVIDSAGTVKFQSTSSTFIDGAIITNATIQDAKIVDLNGSKLDNSSVSNTKISDLSASKIDAGTLTVDGNPAISVTGTGNVILNNGADLIFNAASSGETSYIKFRNSSGTSQGDISWNATTDLYMLRSLSGDCRVFADGGNLELYADTDVDILGVGGRIDIESSGGAAFRADTSGNLALTVGGTVCVVTSGAILRSNGNKTSDLGSASLAWDTVYADDFTNVADILFQNGMVLLEADKVYGGLAGEEGQFFLTNNKRPGFFFDKEGNLYVRGKVFVDTDFDEKFKEFTPIVYEERRERKQREKEARIAQDVAIEHLLNEERKREKRLRRENL